MLIFRKPIRTVYGMQTLFDSAITADIMRTKLKKNGAITGINIIIFPYNNRKNIGEALDNNNIFKSHACFIFN